LINAAGISAKNGNLSFLNPPGTNGQNQNYKALEYLYFAKKINKTKITGLFLADQFAKYKLDSVKTHQARCWLYIWSAGLTSPALTPVILPVCLLILSLAVKMNGLLPADFTTRAGMTVMALDLSAYTYTASLSYKSSNLTT
jgi:hypothetical protein